MKKSNRCPKCQSREIVKIPGVTRPAGVGNNIKTGFWDLNGIPVTRYLCGSCGYIEQWIDAAEDIDRIKDYYGIVSLHQVSPRQAA
jgi:ribosomal protein S27AE